MTPEDVVTHLVAPTVGQGDMLLFLGAGFSLGATSVGGTDIPTSRALAERLAKRMKLPTSDGDVDLQLAWTLASRQREEFGQYLRQQFTVASHQPWQRLVYRFRWRRIYTTNIDDLLPHLYESLTPQEQREVRAEFYNWSDPRPASQRELDLPVIHLHGSVRNLDGGVVFAESEYAYASVQPGDWIREAAFDLASIPACLVGSRFREPDLRAAMHRRQLELGRRATPTALRSFIVLPSFSEVERRYYADQGFEPLAMTAERFFQTLAAALPELEPQVSVLRRRYPHIPVNDGSSAVAAASWFARAFEHVPAAIAAARSERVVESTFFDGASPLWPYIQRGVPAEFHALRTALQSAESYLFAKPGEVRGPKVLAIAGPTGGGKSTVLRQLLARLGTRLDAVYLFRTEGSLDVDAAVALIKASPGPMVLGFDQSTEFFESINDVLTALTAPTSTYRGRLLVVLEGRTHRLARDEHRLSSVTPARIEMSRLARSDAAELLGALDRANYLGALGRMSHQDRIARIVDADHGFGGDLLVTLRTLTRGQRLEELILDDLRDLEPRRPYLLACLVGLAGYPIRASDLCTLAGIRPGDLIEALQGSYSGRLRHDASAQMIWTRHAVIAELHYLNGTTPETRAEDLVQVLRLMSAHFGIDTIRDRPLEYRIYRELVRRPMIQDTLLAGRDDLVEQVYSDLQSAYGHDGIFWLQFGKFYFRQRRYPLAEHCLRKGVEVFARHTDRESFQLLHSLGQLLVRWYASDRSRAYATFEEGFHLLEEQVRIRGAGDPYPHHTMCGELLTVLQARPDTPRIRELTEVAMRAAAAAHPHEPRIGDLLDRWRRLHGPVESSATTRPTSAGASEDGG